ncbi:hypothetical protein DDJ46_16000 [Mycobacteroides abscessus]|nr:hypothetical protein DDJ46_16000 [Mycobacteroides abscessus]
MDVMAQARAPFRGWIKAATRVRQVSDCEMEVSHMVVTEPNKVMVAGDWHGNPYWAEQAIKYAKRSGADMIVHVGDYGFWTPSERTYAYLLGSNQLLEELDMRLIWVDGNHEDHSQLDECNIPGGKPTVFGDLDRIMHLPRGFRWEWWGMTWMALGGAHSVDRSWRREGHDWWPGEVLSGEQVEYASRPGGVDVIVAHDAPRGFAIPGIGSGNEFPSEDLLAAESHRGLVREVVDATKPSLFFHGHYHVNYRARLEREGGTTEIFGLDRDNSTIARNTMFLTREDLGQMVSSR